MAEIVPGWDKAVAGAKKIIGDKGKIPEPKGAIIKAREAENKVWGEFDKARNELEDQILALIDATSAIVDAVDQYRDVIAEDDFDLNAKSDAKKVAAAKKILLTPLDAAIVKVKNNAKNERELNKHLANITAYKQGT
jgi:hypothetical protein